MSLELVNRLSILQDRSRMLTAARNFFAARQIIEVDCPILSSKASVDAYIDLIPAFPTKEKRYLHSSPEYGMKRLLAENAVDMYQLSHVFREGESSLKHNPEFMMAEWYRINFSFEEMIAETCEFIKLFVGAQNYSCITYRQAFLKYADIDYVTASSQELIQCLQNYGIQSCETDKEELLNQILGTIIEPHLGQNELTALIYYPSFQSALARNITIDGEVVGERFEIYHRGVELANGYHELADAQEQKKRFIDENDQRVRLGKEPLPVDDHFLKALEKGLPDCCGVAVGFDRLMMLRHGTNNIRDVIPFHWDNA